MHLSALITAGGAGTRMGTVVPKQFLELDGTPILERTVSIFVGHPLVHSVVITTPPGYIDFCRENILAKFADRKPFTLIPGGPTRQDSVYNGLRALRDADVVAIHDGVRPLVSADVISRTVYAAFESGAAVAGTRVKETVKKQRGDLLETVPRENLWFARTPQVFQTSLILKAHRHAQDTGFLGTDDAVLVERLGHPVIMVLDFDDNIKITSPLDLQIATVLIQSNAGDPALP